MNSRPQPFSAFTTPRLWDDPYISQRMLEQHLDPHTPMASRAHAFIDRSVDWIVDWIVGTLGLHSGSRVVDLGCGPGLYAERLAHRGIGVLGIDVSHRSLAYAHENAQRTSLPITLRHGNYLEADLGTAHDCALLIFEDYCALSPSQRAVLLRRVHRSLRPGGSFVLDVTAAPRFDHVKESHCTKANLMDGFWADGPYIGDHDTWTYPDLRLVLDRYTIRTASATREYWNWMHCLTPEEVAEELRAGGFSAPALYGDVAGSAYDPDSEVFAAITARE